MMDVCWMEFKFRGNHHMKILYSSCQKTLVVQRGQGFLAIEPQKAFSYRKVAPVRRNRNS